MRHRNASIVAPRDVSGAFGAGSKPRRVRLDIAALGTDLATVNLEQVAGGQDGIGRQGRTRVRLPGLGRKIVAAHVSLIRPA